MILSSNIHKGIVSVDQNSYLLQKLQKLLSDGSYSFQTNDIESVPLSGSKTETVPVPVGEILL